MSNYFLAKAGNIWKMLVVAKSPFLTLAVLKTTFLQSGSILTDQGGRSYCVFPKVTFAEDFGS